MGGALSTLSLCGLCVSASLCVFCRHIEYTQQIWERAPGIVCLSAFNVAAETQSTRRRGGAEMKGIRELSIDDLLIETYNPNARTPYA